MQIYQTSRRLVKRHSQWLGLGNDLSGRTSKAQSVKKNDKLKFTKIKTSALQKVSKRMKRQAIE